MGIKGLTKIINKESPDSIRTEQLHNLSGKKVAIDASLFIYKYLMNIRSNGNTLKNKNMKCTSHISGIFYKTVLYLSLGIEPIYIFDGKPPEEKNNIIKDRKLKASRAKKNIENANSHEEKIKLEKQSIRLTKEHIDDIKNLLNLMGITYLHIDGEAEAIGSELCRINYVDYMITEDMDTMAFGCPRLIRNCLDKSIKRNDVISIIDLDKILSDININYDKFIELCILCGCDYCDNIPKIGQVKALSIVKNYKNIEEFINSKHKYIIPQNYIDKFNKSIELFKLYRDKLNPDEIPFVKSEINYKGLRKYLIDECNISSSRVENSIKKIQSNNKYIK